MPFLQISVLLPRLCKTVKPPLGYRELYHMYKAVILLISGMVNFATVCIKRGERASTVFSGKHYGMYGLQ